jgi:hypothetical protein
MKVPARAAGSFSPAPATPPPLGGPFTGNDLYTMPSGLQFFVSYQNYTQLYSSTCSLNFMGASLANSAEHLHCSSPQLEAFEKALEQASLGRVTKEARQSGATYLLESDHRWITAVVSNEDASQGLVNGWVETSVAQPGIAPVPQPGIR